MASKVFEVNDVLPANDQIRITWTQSLGWGTPNDSTTSAIVGMGDSYYLQIEIKLDDGPIMNFSIYTTDNDYYIVESNDNFVSPYTNYGGGHAYCDIALNSPVTITNVDFGMDLFTWEAIGNDIPQGFNITFEENGGTTQTDLTEQTVLPTPLPSTTRVGYTFVNWYYDSAFTQIASAGDTIESNVTLYAKWHNLGSLFTEIADAIRSKDGTSENIRDVDFGERVKQIQGAKELTQAQYNALSVYDDNTYYLIVEE